MIIWMTGQHANRPGGNIVMSARLNKAVMASAATITMSLLLFSAPCFAGLIKTTSDNLVTVEVWTGAGWYGNTAVYSQIPESTVLDTSTGLEWLSPLYTNGMSYNEVTADIEGGNLSGWRFATFQDVYQLFQDAGATAIQAGAYNGQNQYSNIAAVRTLASVFGVTASYGPDWYQIWGRIDATGFPSGTTGVAWAEQFYSNYGDFGDTNPSDPYWQNFPSKDSSSPATGAWLVKNDVPEPSSLALLGLSLLSIGYLAYRRREHSLDAAA